MQDVQHLLLEMARCRTLEEIFDLVASTLGCLPDVALCRIWLQEQADPALCSNCRQFYDCRDHRHCLRLVVSAGRSLVSDADWTQLDGTHRRFALGCGKVGLIAASGEAFHVSDVSPDMPWVTAPDWIAREQIRDFLGQPLLYRGQVLGVLALFCRAPQSPQALNQLRLVADYLAVSLANAQSFAELRRLQRRLELENSYLRNDSGAPSGDVLLGESPALRALRERIGQIACADVPVFITGESGTGKSIVAATIHNQSLAAGGPLVKVHCAAIAPDRFSREFFGAAPTADGPAHIGFFEAAALGTLFLAGIDALSPPRQASLLRTLQDRVYVREGESRPRPLRARLIAAAGRDMQALVRDKLFREDLYYRLNVVPLVIPPLRERLEDLPLLAAHFLEAFKSRFHKPRLRLSAAALRTLRRYDWPGNVRELKNVLLRAVLAARDDATDIDLSAASLRTGASLPRPDAILTESQMRALQRNNIVAALQYCNNRIYGPRGAAALLQINPTTLCSRMKKFGLPTDAGEKRRTGNPSDKQRP